MALSPDQLKKETLRLCHGELTRDNNNIAAYRQRLKELSERVEAIVACGTNEGHPITAAESFEVNLLLDEHKRIGDMAVPMRHSKMNPGSMDGDYVPDTAAGSARFLTRDGKEVYSLSCRERLADLPQPDGRVFTPLSLGKAIIGLTTGNWNNARVERLAMAEGGNAVGGYFDCVMHLSGCKSFGK